MLVEDSKLNSTQAIEPPINPTKYIVVNRRRPSLCSRGIPTKEMTKMLLVHMSSIELAMKKSSSNESYPSRW